MIVRVGNEYKIKQHPVQKFTTAPKDVEKLPQYNPGTIFKHYTPAFFGKRFDETIDYNYFQLPKGAMPDKTQLAAAKSIHQDNNTVCIAPTGTGKTAIANYAITQNLEKGKRTYYTTPLKALSNDKYREFCKLYGEENVGLLTGDIKLKADAPVVIMTTEIFRNMALANYANPEKKSFKDVQTVVFDEAHYINEPDRGKIWEESMMLAPKNIQIIPLTATIGNAPQFSSWIATITNKKTSLIEASPKDRYVPLVYYNYAPKKQVKFQELIRGKVDMAVIKELVKQGALSERQNRAVDMLKEKTGFETESLFETLTDLTKKQPLNHDEFSKIVQKNFHLKELEAQEITQLLIDDNSRKINKLPPVKEMSSKDNYGELIEDLKAQQKLPAIIFKFSRQGCNISARDASRLNLQLTTPEEKKEIQKIVAQYREAGIYLGKKFDLTQLEKGIVSHNAGLMPGYKKLVEDLFSKKLLKVVFATSTLSAGINMPAKTVVITQLEHPDGDEMKMLSANEFHQMSGRAGRRGIDTIGNVVLYNLCQAEQKLAQSLILQKADPIVSKYSPTYNFLTSYYQKSSDETLLDEFIDKTLKIHQAGNYKQQITKGLKEDFENHKKVLEELGYLEKTSYGGYQATLSGEMLSRVHGYNELTLVKMIESKKLEGLDSVELASFAASMVDSKFDAEIEVEKLLAELMIEKCNERSKYDILDAIDESDEYDDKVAETELKNNVTQEGNLTNIFSAYVGYKWAANGGSTIDVFKNLLADPNKNGAAKDFPSFSYNPFKNVTEGELYGLLSQSVDVLKQIINICEFALSRTEFEKDYKYYNKLLKTAQESVELVKQPPIHDSLSVA